MPSEFMLAAPIEVRLPLDGPLAPALLAKSLEAVRTNLEDNGFTLAKVTSNEVLTERKPVGRHMVFGLAIADELRLNVEDDEVYVVADGRARHEAFVRNARPVALRLALFATVLQFGALFLISDLSFFLSSAVAVLTGTLVFVVTWFGGRREQRVRGVRLQRAVERLARIVAG